MLRQLSREPGLGPTPSAVARTLALTAAWERIEDREGLTDVAAEANEGSRVAWGSWDL